jgi:hypothetical protein
MQGFAAILLMFQLLTHGVAGCCWHHEHADHAKDGPTAVAYTDVAEKTCCHHQHAAPDPSEPADSKQHAPDDDSCAESKCVLDISRHRVDLEIPDFVLDFVLATRASASPINIRSARRQECVTDIEPPLRLHALHQVLLI